MFSYEEIKKRPELLLAMTSFNQPEFEKLLLYFQRAWEEYVQVTYIERPDRQRRYGGGKLESSIPLIEDKLLFILYYIKAYPLQEIIAYSFRMTQSTANNWVHVLSEILKNALNYGGYLPERDPQKVEAIMNENSEDIYGIDGTERRINRPVDNVEQKKHYSGKKKLTQLKISLLAKAVTKRSTT